VLLGSPGLGKSRLIDEVGRRLGDQVRIVAAQCDAAGGATFAPVAEALRQFLRRSVRTPGQRPGAVLPAIQVMPAVQAEALRASSMIAPEIHWRRAGR
jgi:predicted ATPase